MKTFFAIFALCLAASQAAVPTPVNYEIMVNDVIHEAEKIAIDTALALEHQFEEIVIDPLQQVDEVLQNIEGRKEENEPCVVAEEPTIEMTLDILHHEMSVCGMIAARTSAEIASDVNEATQQLVFDGLDVGRTYKKCKNYKNSVLKNTCYARLSVKATLYLKNSRRSIKTINESTNERVPAVFSDADVCTHTASENTILELEQVNANIDNCIARL